MAEVPDIPKRMKAAVLFGQNDVRIVEKDVPKPGPGEVLVKVAACGICGTDIKIITRGMPKMPPYGEFTFGHEWAGTVVALGDTVDEFKIGDRVAIEAHKGCGRCENCLAGNYTACLNYGRLDKGHRTSGMTVDGGFAEYAVHHVNSVYRIPDNISFEEATFVTTAGCTLYALDVAGGYVAGQTVAVIGPGPIGLSAVQGAKALGAEKVVLAGTRESRLSLGREMGADHTVNVRDEDAVARVMELTNGRGADVVLECSGNPEAVDMSLKMAKKAGTVVLVAFYKQPVTADLSYAVLNQIKILTVRGEGKNNCARALSLMSQGKIDAKKVITHTFSLDELNTAIDTFVNRVGDAMKVVVLP